MKKTKYDYRQVKANFYPWQYEILEANAKSEGKTKAQYIRENLGFIFENPRKRLEPQPKKIEYKVERTWIYEMNAIGKNLNQAVEAMHTKKGLIELRALQKIIDQFNDLDEKVTTYILDSAK